MVCDNIGTCDFFSIFFYNEELNFSRLYENISSKMPFMFV